MTKSYTFHINESITIDAESADKAYEQLMDMRLDEALLLQPEMTEDECE